jgi:hypothetical protein
MYTTPWIGVMLAARTAILRITSQINQSVSSRACGTGLSVYETEVSWRLLADARNIPLTLLVALRDSAGVHKVVVRVTGKCTD